MNLKETLQNAHTARVDEVEMYQLNIDNYKLAIQLIDEDNDAQLDGFKSQLNSLLEAEMLEQKKAKIMLRVIEKRLEEVAT